MSANVFIEEHPFPYTIPAIEKETPMPGKAVGKVANQLTVKQTSKVELTNTSSNLKLLSQITWNGIVYTMFWLDYACVVQYRSFQARCK